MKVTFLGAGVYGTALGNLAASNGHEVKYYDPYKFPDIKLKDAISGADLLIYAAPAGAVNTIVPELPADAPLLSVSKGIITPYPFRKIQNFAMLAGAAFAEDIENDTPRFGDQILLTASTPLAEELFTAPKIRIEFFDDAAGIMLMASLKVAVSIYAGYLYPDGFAEDSDDKTLPRKQVFLEEIRPEYERWLDINGHSHDLLPLSCGFPDVILSTTPTSRNFAFGQTLGKTGTFPEQLGTVEGLTFFKTLGDYPDLKIPPDSVLVKFYLEKLKPLMEASHAA